MEDTIAAISTPFGEGGIGIVRMSGSLTEKILDEVFVAKKTQKWKERQSHRLYLGHLQKEGKIIDEVLAVIMKEPHSYTGEDVGEVHCHGGLLAVNLALEAVLGAGARLAEPGEFTRRAFLNGRLDLVQSEAIIDIIRSQSSAGLELAVEQLGGSLPEAISNCQKQLLRLMAYFEASIDFPEDEIDTIAYDEMDVILTGVENKIKGLLDGFSQGKIIREGLKTVILGKPNVGKSSLLNALLQEDRAIVTEIPGTTRDVIEETVNLNGILLRIMDTAGIRPTEDLVEKIGIEKTKEVLKKADLALLVLDAGERLTGHDEMVYRLVQGEGIPSLVLINKIDVDKPMLSREEAHRLFGEVEFLEISALKGQGLEALSGKIREMVGLGKVGEGPEPLLTRLRHAQSLKKALEHLQLVRKGLDSGMPVDFLSIDLKEAWESLGSINGTSIEDDVLDTIFSEFCIGK